MSLSVGDTIKIKKIGAILSVDEHSECYNNISTFLMLVGNNPSVDNNLCAFIPHHLRPISDPHPLIILFPCDITEGIIKYSNAILTEKNIYKI